MFLCEEQNGKDSGAGGPLPSTALGTLAGFIVSLALYSVFPDPPGEEDPFFPLKIHQIIASVLAEK